MWDSSKASFSLRRRSIFKWNFLEVRLNPFKNAGARTQTTGAIVRAPSGIRTIEPLCTRFPLSVLHPITIHYYDYRCWSLLFVSVFFFVHFNSVPIRCLFNKANIMRHDIEYGQTGWNKDFDDGQEICNYECAFSRVCKTEPEELTITLSVAFEKEELAGTEWKVVSWGIIKKKR